MKIMIDRSSIRRNPNAGQTSFMVAGPKRTIEEITWLPDGTETKSIIIKQDAQTMHCSPQPQYLFNYEPTKVKCECGIETVHTDLEYGDNWRECPHCSCAVDVEFEKIEDVHVNI